MRKVPISDSLFLTTDRHVLKLVRWMSSGVYEKEQIVAMALLCAVAGENIFLLGPPGTAKSLVARRLKGVFRDARSFDYLMSRFSTPDEIFGPISISKLKECDCYERLTDGYLPTADVVFLDEIWKAGPSIQNTLLTAINEHIYQNGTATMRLPMKVLVAASNELPGRNEGLEALWDRFLVRMISNCIEDDDNFERMLLTTTDQFTPLDENLRLTDELYAQWRADSEKTGVSSEVMASIRRLRRAINNLADSGAADDKRLDFYISDRRWKKAFRLMQTSAYLNGRAEIDSSDLLLLIHCMWNSPACRERINRQVAISLWHNVTDESYDINDKLRRLVMPESNDNGSEPAVKESDFKEVYNTYWAIENFRDTTSLIPKWDYKRLSSLEETEGVEYIDNSLRMPVVQIVNNNSVINLNLSTKMGKPGKVRLMKCSGGIMIDGIPYSLIRKGGGKKTKAGVIFRRLGQELAGLKERYSQCLTDWDDRQRCILDEAYRNIFISRTDIDMIKSEMKSVTASLAETGIRLKNVAKILNDS